MQALMLMWQIMSEKAATSNDRFYRALYTVLGSDTVPTSTKGPMFLSLLFKVGVVTPLARAREMPD
jgi:hypothetical protein